MERSLAVLLCATAVLLGACSQGKAPQRATPPEEQAPAAEPPKPQSMRDLMDQYRTLPEAIEAMKPLMTDVTDNMSPGAVSLAAWAALEPVTIADFKALPRSKAALVLKDSDQERGKGICTSGSIIEIAAQKNDELKVYVGGLYNNAGQIYRFIAARSTGELVQNSYATFCGAVIGREDYSNSAGGMAHAISLVGMFDLPENRPAGTEDGS